MPRRPSEKRTKTIVFRVSESESARIERLAEGSKLSAYLRSAALNPGNGHSTNRRLSADERQPIARMLALLGQSRLSSNLNQLARAANSGSLPLSPEVEATLLAAAQDIREMRALLIAALGLEDGS